MPCRDQAKMVRLLLLQANREEQFKAKLQDTPPLDVKYHQNLPSNDLNWELAAPGSDAHVRRGKRREVSRIGADEEASWEARDKNVMM